MIRLLQDEKVNLDKAAEGLGVCKESLTKDNRRLLQEWVAKRKTKSSKKS